MNESPNKSFIFLKISKFSQKSLFKKRFIKTLSQLFFVHDNICSGFYKDDGEHMNGNLVMKKYTVLVLAHIL